jgi:hypothetical protein
MKLPQFRIRSLLIAVALVAAVLAATIEIERAPWFAIMVYIFVPAIAIGLWQRLGLRGILVAVVPSWLLVFLAWVPAVLPAAAMTLASFIGILAALFTWRVLDAQARGSPLGSLELSALWGLLSMMCSLVLALFCIFGAMMISHWVPIRW